MPGSAAGIGDACHGRWLAWTAPALRPGAGRYAIEPWHFEQLLDWGGGVPRVAPGAGRCRGPDRSARGHGGRRPPELRLESPGARRACRGSGAAPANSADAATDSHVKIAEGRTDGRRLALPGTRIRATTERAPGRPAARRGLVAEGDAEPGPEDWGRGRPARRRGALFRCCCGAAAARVASPGLRRSGLAGHRRPGPRRRRRRRGRHGLAPRWASWRSPRRAVRAVRPTAPCRGCRPCCWPPRPRPGRPARGRAAAGCAGDPASGGRGRRGGATALAASLVTTGAVAGARRAWWSVLLDDVFHDGRASLPRSTAGRPCRWVGRGTRPGPARGRQRTPPASTPPPGGPSLSACPGPRGWLFAPGSAAAAPCPAAGRAATPACSMPLTPAAHACFAGGARPGARR